jgi:hypothetical protein
MMRVPLGTYQLPRPLTTMTRHESTRKGKKMIVIGFCGNLIENLFFLPSITLKKKKPKTGLAKLILKLLVN